MSEVDFEEYIQNAKKDNSNTASVFPFSLRHLQKDFLPQIGLYYFIWLIIIVIYLHKTRM